MMKIFDLFWCLEPSIERWKLKYVCSSKIASAIATSEFISLKTSIFYIFPHLQKKANADVLDYSLGSSLLISKSTYVSCYEWIKLNCNLDVGRSLHRSPSISQGEKGKAKWLAEIFCGNVTPLLDRSCWFVYLKCAIPGHFSVIFVISYQHNKFYNK